jgi:hypothetical protein
VPFALYEYDDAFSRFFGQTVRALARARSPLLSEMQVVEVSGTLGTRIQSREGSQCYSRAVDILTTSAARRS